MESNQGSQTLDSPPLVMLWIDKWRMYTHTITVLIFSRALKNGITLWT